MPRKRYGLGVIGYTMARHTLESRSLRQVVWRDLGGDRTPSHTTLHGWSEGFGAYVQGRPGGEVGDATPAMAVVAEAASRDRRVRGAFEHPFEIDPRRYRSEARKERLTAGARLLRLALALAPPPESLTECNRLVLAWGFRCGIGFRSRFLRTPIEHAAAAARPHSHEAFQPKEEFSCGRHGRPPPGATR